VPGKRGALEDAELVSAAETLASWARARRATWTSAPLPAPSAPVEDAFVVLPPAPAPVPSPAPVIAQPVASPAATPQIAAPVQTPRRPAPPWIGRAIFASVLLVAVVFGARALVEKLPDLTARMRSAPPPATNAASAAATTGSIDVKTTPPGATVLVDGKARGVTPLSLGGVAPGRHEIALTSADGTVRRTVTVAAGETAMLEEAIFSGWVAVLAPFDLTIAENGRELRVDERQQVLLPPGSHQLRLANRPLGFETTKRVEVKPGETTRLEIVVAPSTLTVTATDAAEVWVDGVRAGETPLTNAQIALGTHDVLVKRAAGGERRFTITVGVSPASIHAAF
jgi:hypothetical protein